MWEADHGKGKDGRFAAERADAITGSAALSFKQVPASRWETPIDDRH